MKHSSMQLYDAVRSFRVAEVQQIIEEGVDVNEGFMAGDTPLLIAVRANHASITGLLVDAGADVNVQDSQGMTPLMYAARFGASQIAHLMMRHGARQSLTNNKGLMAYDCAMEMHHYETAKLLAQNDEHRRAIDAALGMVTPQNRTADRQQVLRQLSHQRPFRPR